MTRIVFFLTLSVLIKIPQLFAQDDVELFSYWEYHSDVQNSLYKHFAREAFRQLDERKELVNDLKTKEDWLDRQSDVRQQFSEIVGDFPQKTPLYDLSDLMAGLSPRNLLIVNPVSADGSPSDTSVVQECLEFPSKVFDLQRDGVFDLMENLDSLTTQKQVVKWLRNVPN